MASQMSIITQLTKQVPILQLAHNEINSKLNKLTEFIMAQLAAGKTHLHPNVKLPVVSEEAPANQHDEHMQPATCKVPASLA